MNTAIVRPFMVATRRVFEKMLECPCRVGKPAVSRGLNSTEDTVRAIVEVSGSHRGYMVLNLPGDIANVAASLLGVSNEIESSAQNAWAGDQIAHFIKTLVRRNPNSPDMKLAALPNSDGRFESSVLCQQGAWLEVPMIGRFGKFSFALCIKPVQTLPEAQGQAEMAKS
ncbi:MAG: hypothetical protein DHS20C16_07080 [Phycisphaerae bacterium]|nr:MAG: hypothetical protein DHS20C16_07080 [Phycisphaerae bacterium]